MSAAANTKIARRFFDDVLVRRSNQAVDELIAPGALIRLPTGQFAGPEGVKRASAQMGSAFADLQIEVKELVADGNRVFAEWTLCGIQRRELLGVPPSGERECIAAASQFYVEDNRILAHWMTEN